MTGSDSDIARAARIFQENYGRIVTVAKRYVPTSDLVYDVVQQTYIDFITKVQSGDYTAEQDYRPLLDRIAMNRALKCWRERKEHLPKYQQLIAEKIMARTRKDEDEIESANQQLEALYTCLGKMPRQGRRLIERHYFEKTTIEKLAQEENQKPGSMRKLFCRIRMILRDCILKSTS